MTTMNGSALFLAQFAGDPAALSNWASNWDRLAVVGSYDASVNSSRRKGVWVNV